jgi:hypothetical protein
MPISGNEDCTAEHWIEVKEILTDAVRQIKDIDFAIDLVSNADDTGVIQRRIVQNLYRSDVIVCDVSTKNPNVMFELGMRLAFDKATVIVKDDKTNYSFDTAVIEHINYPRDLRFGSITRFKEQLAQKVRSTFLAGKDPNNSVFLKNFGTFHVAKINDEVVGPNEAIIKMIGDLHNELAGLRRSVSSLKFNEHISAHVPPTDQERENSASQLNYVLHRIRQLKKSNPTKTTEELLNDLKNPDELFASPAARKMFRDREDFMDAYEIVRRHALLNGL